MVTLLVLELDAEVVAIQQEVKVFHSKSTLLVGISLSQTQIIVQYDRIVRDLVTQL